MKRTSQWAATIAAALIFISVGPTTLFAADAALDARNYPGPAWSPYIVGAGIGVLSWLTFYFSDKPIGASSFYATVAGLLGKTVAPDHTDRLDYFKQNPPAINWSFVFVLAAVAGAAFAAYSGGEFHNEWLPPMWSARFGDNIAFRGLVAFVGGCLMAFGARSGWRMHQRSRDQRYVATQCRVLDRRHLFLHWRRRRSDASIPGCSVMINPGKSVKKTSVAPPQFVSPASAIVSGILFGFVFGFLLQKGGVGTYHILIGQLLLQDWTVVKIMATAVVVGMIGIFHAAPLR